jgi:macrolide transport system ATP-binding/permease protein
MTEPRDNVLIRVRDLHRVYAKGDNEVRALDGIDLDIREGEFIAIMGQSGSGKSTLMHLLGCLDQPTSGSYRLDGVEVSQLDDAGLSDIRNRKVGFVFQTFNLLSDCTAADNIALPLVYAGVGRKERLETARTAAEAMGLGNRLWHRPTELSGGQVQRVAIARALAGSPRLILADEPTGNLDTATGAEIMGIFHRLHLQGVTIIMVTHDAKLARYANRIISLRDGRIVSEEHVTEPLAAASVPTEIRITPPARPASGRRMGLWDLVRIGVREGLWAHKLRTFLTMLGVMFGVASVIAIVAVAEGARIELEKHIEAMGANTVRLLAKTLDGEELNEARSKGDEGLSREDARIVSEVLGDTVSHTAPMKKVNADVLAGSVRGDAEVWATTPDFPPIVNFRLARGAFFTWDEVNYARSVCVLGDQVARDLFGAADPIGRTVTIGRTTFDVVGVLARKPVSDEDFNRQIFVPLSAALVRVKSASNTGEIDRIVFSVRESSNVKPAAEAAAAVVRRRHAGVNDIEVSIPEEKLQLQQKTRRLMNTVLVIMALIALTVGGIGIMNIMLATVTERIREIGIRRSIGATQNDILKQFLTEAVGISFIGGIVGIVVGFFGGYGIAWMAELSQASVSWQATLLGFGVAVSVGLGFGIYPAWIAAKQDPIEALRYE